MKTLLTLFSEERNQLQIEVEKSTNVEQVVTLIENRLDNLERNYISQLNVSQIRLASLFLDTLRQSLATLAATNQIQTIPPKLKQINEEAGQFFSQKLILKLLQALICIGILGSLFSYTKTTPGVWMAILLTFILVGVEVVLQLDKENQQTNLTAPDLEESPQQILQVDSKILLDHLADALNTIDIAVTPVGVINNKSDERVIEELPELLNFLQRLLGASILDRPQMTLELAKLLPQILREQGIEAKIYQPQDLNNEDKYFDFEPSIDPSNKNYVTITPALLKGDRLLRRGRVIEPESIKH